MYDKSGIRSNKNGASPHQDDRKGTYTGRFLGKEAMVRIVCSVGTGGGAGLSGGLVPVRVEDAPSM